MYVKICDLCGKIIGKKDDLYRIIEINGTDGFIKRNYEICKDCGVKALLHPERILKEAD